MTRAQPCYHVRSLSIVLLALITACADNVERTEGMTISVDAVSNRADLVSGGDVLVAVQLPSPLTSGDVMLDLNGQDLSDRMRLLPDGRTLALLQGLREGENLVTARAGGFAAQLTVTNHAAGGPVFSGPQVQPWVCATPEAEGSDADAPATVASGLRQRATDKQCNIPSEVKYYYRTTEPCGYNPDSPGQIFPCFKDYPQEKDRPDDVAIIPSVTGNQVPYIVRVERGTLNRGIHDIAVLADPSREIGPFNPNPHWNGGLVHLFGGSNGFPRRQHPPNSGWQASDVLAGGFMVSVSSLTDQALNSNKVVAAETLMMLKEYISEHYGTIDHTIGWGCSGGSVMQLFIAATYPGLLNGVLPSCTYPDSLTTSLEVLDCVLLDNFFGSGSFADLTTDLSTEQILAKRTAIAGHKNEKGCLAWSGVFGESYNPGNFLRGDTETNNCQLPTGLVFDPEHNPDGLHCSAQDHEISLWGKEPGHDYARRVMDNRGVQYGLHALAAGDITTTEFITLNEQVGGIEIGQGLNPERTHASIDSVALAYRMGFVTDARQWATVPIIDLRGNNNEGIHMNWRSFAVRDRLDRALGHHDNQVIWRFGPNLWPPAESTAGADTLNTMNQWLQAIQTDTSSRTVQEKILHNRPEAAHDACYLDGDYVNRVTDPDRCDADPALAFYGSPRQAAGGPLAENILKCALRPLARADYNVTFTESEWGRLRSVFTDGVCDWSVPGIGEQPAIPWLDYSAGPGGQPLGPAPKSEPISPAGRLGSG